MIYKQKSVFIGLAICFIFSNFSCQLLYPQEKTKANTKGRTIQAAVTWHMHLCVSYRLGHKANSFIIAITGTDFVVFIFINHYSIIFVNKIFTFQTFAKTLVNADRCSLFLVDSKCDELYANLFDIGTNENCENSSKKNKKIRYLVSTFVCDL